MNVSSAGPSHGRLPSLDGWRAISILVVLGGHAMHTYDFPRNLEGVFDRFFPSRLGVRCFFVISGFLITRLLIAEHIQSGKISLRRFYVRRALRILPVYLAFLAVLGVLQAATPLHQDPSIWCGDLTFTVNFLKPPFFSSNLWSLAVEEQFYLVWPAVLMLVGFGNTRRLLQGCMAAMLLPPFLKLLQYSGYSVFVPKIFDSFFDVFSTFINVDALAVGCAASILYVKYKKGMDRSLHEHPVWPALVGGGLTLHPWLLPGAVLRMNFFLCCSELLQGIGLAVLLLQSVVRPQFYPFLNWRPVIVLGVLSYSIYIWHMPFADLPRIFGLSHAWFMSFHTWWIAVLAIATVSHFCLERPFLRWRARFRGGA